MGEIEINGHHLHVAFQGPEDGCPVVLLHHGLGAVQAWKAQMPALASAGYRVIAYDRWGYGDSDLRPALSVPYFLDDQADLMALLEAFRVEQAALIGHSDGGTIALYFAARHPQRVKCLVTVAAHVYVEPKMLPGIERVRKVYESDGRFRAGLSRLHGDKTDSVFSNWYHGWVQPGHLIWDMRATLRKINCPTLVIQGIEDEHATPQHARDIAEEVPGAELWLVEEAAHMLPQDKSEIFNRRVVSFLNARCKVAPAQSPR